jgi:hypothetical protein
LEGFVTVPLTTGEKRRVKAGRLAEKPTYFNAQSGQNVSISEDFEAFLILQSKPTKQEAVSWASQALANQDVDLLRDLLLADALAADQNDASAALEEVNAELARFDEFRGRFAPGKFASVGEIQTLLSDLQLGLDRLVNLKDRLRHLEVYDGVQSELLLSAGLTENQVKETGSWIGPLLAY